MSGYKEGVYGWAEQGFAITDPAEPVEFLGNEKYQPLIEDIYKGLGIPASLYESGTKGSSYNDTR